jgi:hypothetical protein
MSQTTQPLTPSPLLNPMHTNDPDRAHRKKKNKHFAPVGSGYVGKCEEIKEHIYNVGPTRSIDLFAEMTREIGEYLACTIKNGAEFCNAFDPEDLGFETIVQPPEPEDINNPVLVQQWEFTYKTYYDQVQHWLTASSQAFAVVLGQCSPAIVDQVQAHEDWEETSQENDVIGLLHLIHNCMYIGVTTKRPKHTLIDVQNKLFTFWQSNRMSNAEYLHSFHGLMHAIEFLSRDFGVDESWITWHLKLIQQDPDDAAKWAAAKAAVQEQYLGTLFMIKSDAKRYGALIATLQNDFISRHNCYPNTFNAAYNMLVNYVNPNQERTFDI